MTKKIIYQIVEYRATDDEPAQYNSYKTALKDRKALEVMNKLNDVMFIIEEVAVDVDYIVGEEE
tara:strand:+ start:4476 stop:4667 length:192 start_codon:yes stop_codon:yes gene_type:complete